MGRPSNLLFQVCHQVANRARITREMQELALVASSALISSPKCVECAVASRLTVTLLQICVELFSPWPTFFQMYCTFVSKMIGYLYTTFERWKTCLQMIDSSRRLDQPLEHFDNEMLRHFDGKCTQGAIQKPFRCIPGSAAHTSLQMICKQMAVAQKRVYSGTIQPFLL